MIIVLCFFISAMTSAKELSESSFLIVRLEDYNMDNQHLWNFLLSDVHSGIEINISEQEGKISFPGQQGIESLFARLQSLMSENSSRIVPVFFNYAGNPGILDSLISNSQIASHIFYLPRGEAWPPLEYLVHSNRRILFFVTGEGEYSGQTLHHTDDYTLWISASSGVPYIPNAINMELFLIEDFDKLPVQTSAGGNIRNLVPDYINYLLESWTKYGKRPNFIFVGDNIFDFDFIISQLNSFTCINGTIRGTGRNLEKVYWRNPEILVTGGRFSFPYLGGQELTLTPFVPGYRLVPEQIIVTGEMEVPESYHIMASHLNLGDGLTGSFHFDESVMNEITPSRVFPGENYSFSMDIERGPVLKLPEGSSINLGSPDIYGLRNSSFSVSCFVKFSEILEFGDNAVLGNYESEYRRGLHLILRSGHPYFGLWANDYISEEKLKPNIWYHMVWRYIIETGEQAIFLNGRNIGSSTGHPPFSGIGDIYLGSALSQGASLRGYIDNLNFWNRPLGSEEISRLALNEEILLEEASSRPVLPGNILKPGLAILISLSVITALVLILPRRKKSTENKLLPLPETNTANQINLFGGFRAVNQNGKDVTAFFTPKVKELFLFILLSTIKNGRGAAVSEIDETLWPGLPVKKGNNNRAVTLNKLRRIIRDFQGLEIVTYNGFLQARLDDPFFCDFAEAFKLCQLPGELDKKQLDTFFLLVQKGRFLKEINPPWLDEMRGYTGNLMTDNLLKLASYCKKDHNLQKMEAIARRILDYDDLNEEAIWLQVWTLNQTNKSRQARFHFDSFCAKYEESLKERYPMTFDEFNRHFADLF
jgi:two-component SAPR family response regulator